uniref:E2F/DP family winged-helix DNA-binding domain-containing protein n=1 Tax=Globodera rostochiensis TaxID=31243 RepID=A0A914HZX9_GLORO
MFPPNISNDISSGHCATRHLNISRGAFTKMDGENEYIDVCGEGEDDENKENCDLRTVEGGPMDRRKFPKMPSLEATCSSSKEPKNTREEFANGEEEQSDEEDGAETRSSLGGTSPDGAGRHEMSGTAKRRSGAPRKEKSLGRLCNRFLERMGEESRDGRDIHLESVARKMSVEKRRIYDIVNVMEALEAMSKTNKSFYRWHGLGQLPKLIHSLQSEAQLSNLPQRVDEVAKKMCTFVELSNFSPTPQSLFENDGKNDGIRRDSLTADGTPAPNCSELTECEFDEGIANRDRCGKNSLAQLCRRFLMVLLSKKSRKVSLDVTSTVLIKNPDKEGFEPPPRSKCRRLYDIANVLVAMRLILKKHALFGTKKIPLFEYCGPEPDADPAAGHLRMLEFLQRSGLTKIAAESVKAAGEEREMSDRKKENGSRKRKREFTAEINQTSVKKEADDPMQNSTEAINAKKAKCEEMNTKLPPMAVTIRQKTLPRPKPMMPPSFPTAGCFEVGGSSPAQQSSAIHSHHQPTPFFCPPRPPQQSLPFWPPQMALISTLIGRQTAQPSHLASFPSQNFPQLSPAPFPTFSAAPSSKTLNAVPVSKVRHSVQSILGVSQKENIGKMSPVAASEHSLLIAQSIQTGPSAAPKFQQFLMALYAAAAACFDLFTHFRTFAQCQCQQSQTIQWNKNDVSFSPII